MTEIKYRRDMGAFLANNGLLGEAAEVGVCDGVFAEEILGWGFDKLYLVDLWAHVDGEKAELGGWDDAEHDAARKTCMDRFKGKEHRIVELRGWTHEMAMRVPDGSLDFCYIDATHYYDYVRRDLEAYWPKLRPGVGAVMAGHDYLNPGLTVKAAADEFAASLGVPIHTIPEDHFNDASFWMQKP